MHGKTTSRSHYHAQQSLGRMSLSCCTEISPALNRIRNCVSVVSGLFIPGFPKLLRYQDHFEYVLKKTIPKIFKFMVC